ncbi:MAG: AAA family ATPase [Angustibacter sp.]
MTRLGPAHPTWLRDIDSSLPVASLFVLHGNLRDRYLVPDDAGAWSPLDLHQALWDVLRRSGFRALLRHTPTGLRLYPDDDAARRLVAEVTGIDAAHLGEPVGPDQLAHVMRSISTCRTAHVALSIDYVSQWRPAGEAPTDPEHALMQAALQLVHDAQPVSVGEERRTSLYNPVFWLVDRPADLPAWLAGGADGIRQVPIPLPDLDERATLAERLLPAVASEAGGASAATAETATRFAERSEGMTLAAMVATAQLAMDQGLGPERIDDAVRAYRVGQVDNPWARGLLRERIRDGEALLTRRVRGQQRAVRHALDILIRTSTGMTGAERAGSASGPRGILFFAGPTGVGKTELAKAITDLVFGDESAYVRFDMSEFSSEQSEARLIGSPPGYVGHGEGGELTNAVRQRPFSLVLFDEVEKAHPRILDKFLQILSDGRLTDGSGNTVYFGETLIVFTSNLGVPDVPPGTAVPVGDELERQVKAAIEYEFAVTINRPELLGRIGDNIVVFDYIDPTTARQLAGAFVDNVLARAADQGVRLTMADTVREEVIDLAVADLSKGGRGVGRAVESALVNPLARAMFSLDGRTEVRITALRKEAGGWHTVELG